MTTQHITCAQKPALESDEGARIAFLLISGLIVAAYVFLELFGGRPLAIDIGSFALNAPQAAVLVSLSRLPFRGALSSDDIDVLFYGTLYVGAAAVKLHPAEDLAMVLDAALGIAILAAISCAPRRKRS